MIRKELKLVEVKPSPPTGPALYTHRELVEAYLCWSLLSYEPGNFARNESRLRAWHRYCDARDNLTSGTSALKKPIDPSYGYQRH